MSTYVMSDIHGNSRRFQSILDQIKLQPEDTLYILGDVIDRFPDGIRILRQLMSMNTSGDWIPLAMKWQRNGKIPCLAA